MSVDWFFKLKEYDSLSKERISYLKAMKDQEDRLSALNVRRHDALNESVSLKKELSDLEQLLFETEKNLKQAEQQRTRLFDSGGDDKKIAAFKSEATRLEEEAFGLLEKIDYSQGQLSDNRTFLIGIEKTIAEISSEVLSEKEMLGEKLRTVDLRLKLLLEELPDDFRGLLQRTLSKNLAIGPFTRIENGSCFFCRYKMSRQDEAEIDVQKQLKVCPQCSRIFLPYGA